MSTFNIFAHKAPVSGTKDTPPKFSSLIFPSACFVYFIRFLNMKLPQRGIRSTPSDFNWSISGFGTAGAAAVTIMRS